MTYKWPTRLSVEDVAGFANYLASKRGAKIRETACPRTVLAYEMTDRCHNVHFRLALDDYGLLQWPLLVGLHYEQFEKDRPFATRVKEVKAALQSALAKPPEPRAKTDGKLGTLLLRDGWDCWFCGTPMSEATVSIEHLLARSKGGREGLANLALAHIRCNSFLDARPIVEKVNLRDLARAYVAQHPGQPFDVQTFKESLP